MPNARNYKPEEDEIIRLLKEHKYTEACEKISLKYKNAIHRRCASLLWECVNDPWGEADGLADEIIAEFCSKIKKFNPAKASVGTVLYRLTTYRLKTKRRKAFGDLKKHDALERNPLLSDATISNSRDPEKILIDRELLQIVDQALKTLPTKQWVIWSMKWQDYSTAEIAEIMGMSSESVNTAFHRAKERFDEIIRRSNRLGGKHFIFKALEIAERRLDEAALQYFADNPWAYNTFTCRYRIHQYFWHDTWRLRKSRECYSCGNSLTFLLNYYRCHNGL